MGSARLRNQVKACSFMRPRMRISVTVLEVWSLSCEQLVNLEVIGREAWILHLLAESYSF